MVLGLVWRLILTTQIASLNETAAVGLVGDEHKVRRSCLLLFSFRNVCISWF
jgi:hypothetical protein